MNSVFFTVYPYVCLSILAVGLVFRYVATPGEWNARSSEIFERPVLRVGSPVFHFAILLSFFGHVGGLMLPEALLRAVGLTARAHLAVATLFGQALAPLVILGLGLLLWRRIAVPAVKATTLPMDMTVLFLILINAVTGCYQTYVAHYQVFVTVGPWLRSVLALRPDAALMADVPVFMQLHVVCGLTIFAIVPFSRLVHLFSAPFTYIIRPLILYRRHYGELPIHRPL